METHEVKVIKTPVRDFFLRTIAVLGLIAILLLGAWGIIQLAFAIPSVFSNLGGGAAGLFSQTATSTTSNKEVITVSLPSSVGNGQALAVSWTHANASNGSQYSYAISYACQAGLSVKAPLPNGSYQEVPCNTLFNYVNASQHMTVVPSVTGASQPLAVTVTATKLSTGTISAQGTASTNVTAGANSANTSGQTTKPATSTTKPVTTTKPSTTYYPAARPATMYGYGDLAVRITSVAPSYGTTVVKFVIENDGTNVIPAGWTFNATLPINGSYTFGSQAQQALYPGDKIAYTLTFAGGNQASQYSDYNNQYGYSSNSGYTSSSYSCNGYACTNNNVVTNGYPYNYSSGYGYNTGYQTAVISITADPQNFVQEYNKGNNTAQTTVPLY